METDDGLADFSHVRHIRFRLVKHFTHSKYADMSQAGGRAADEPKTTLWMTHLTAKRASRGFVRLACALLLMVFLWANTVLLMAQ